MREDSDRSADKFEVDHETLADFGLVFHDAVAGMDHDAGDEDHIGHVLSSIAAATRSACTVSGDIMGSDDPRAAFGREQMRRDRAAEALMRFRRRHRADEALARGADQQRQTEDAQFVEPGQRRHALFLGLAKADAGIEHDVIRRNARLGGDLQRALKEGGDILHDIDAGVGAVAVVHDDDGRLAPRQQRCHARDRAAGPRHRWR